MRVLRENTKRLLTFDRVCCCLIASTHRRSFTLRHAAKMLNEQATQAPRRDPNHWHASQLGSSMAQNLMSDPAVASPSLSAGKAAAEARFALALEAPPLLDTAFMCPAFTVDFSACVAPTVRR